MDYSAQEQTEEQLNEQIKRASVICVVYAVDEEETLERVSSYWMPLIRQNHPDVHCPVVLVGNKIDLVEYSTIDVSFLQKIFRLALTAVKLTFVLRLN